MNDTAKTSATEAASRVDRLLSSDDASFPRQAYELLLGRAIDEQGERFYGARLAAGASRREVLRELADSDEARRRLAAAPELADALAQRLGRGETPRSVEQLLALPEAEFAAQALRAIVGGAAGQAAEDQLRGRLQGGLARHRLLLELTESPGARAPAAVPLAGFEAWLARVRTTLYPVATSVAELMALHDEAFVDCAYKTLLGRAPDPSGLSHYGGALRDGRSRSSILLELASSSESRAHGPAVRGLGLHLVGARLARLPLVGPWLAALAGAESLSSRASERRILQALARRMRLLEANAVTPAAGAGQAAPSGGSVRGIESELLARQDALIEIQRDSFDREMNALRRLVLDRIEAGRHRGAPVEIPPEGRHRRRVRRPRS